MQVLTEARGDILILTVVGSLDAMTAPAFSSELDRIINEGNARLVVDFSQTDYIASAGVRVLLKAIKATRAMNGDLAACGVNDELIKVFEMTGIKGIIQFYPDATSAAQSL